MPPLYKCSVISANYHFHRTREKYYSIKTKTLIHCAGNFFFFGSGGGVLPPFKS